MKTIKVSLKNYQTKQNTTFTKVYAKGKYIPIATAELETNYTIKFVADGTSFKLPTKEGFYTLAVSDCWIDTRPSYADKNIVRVKAVRMVFEGEFPSTSNSEK